MTIVISAIRSSCNADKYLFTRETFAEFPDLRVSGLDFKDIKKISDANPQQAEVYVGIGFCSTSRTGTACGCRHAWFAGRL